MAAAQDLLNYLNVLANKLADGVGTIPSLTNTVTNFRDAAVSQTLEIGNFTTSITFINTCRTQITNAANDNSFAADFEEFESKIKQYIDDTVNSSEPLDLALRQWIIANHYSNAPQQTVTVTVPTQVGLSTAERMRAAQNQILFASTLGFIATIVGVLATPKNEESRNINIENLSIFATIIWVATTYWIASTRCLPENYISENFNCLPNRSNNTRHSVVPFVAMLCNTGGAPNILIYSLNNLGTTTQEPTTQEYVKAAITVLSPIFVLLFALLVGHLIDAAINRCSVSMSAARSRSLLNSNHTNSNNSTSLNLNGDDIENQQRPASTNTPTPRRWFC